MSEEQREWHRFFGMAWFDLLHDQPVTVEMEKDVSLQQQLLDVVIVRKLPGVTLTVDLPDGFDDLGNYNLISFKSHREPFSGEALNELISYYVPYRKLVSPKVDELLPESEFRLYAVAARFPRDLNLRWPLQEIQAGVYTTNHPTGIIRVIVLNRLPQHQQNGMLHLFTAQRELLQYGGQVYRPRSESTSSLLYQLYERYREEGIAMPFTPEEFENQAIERISRDPRMIEKISQDAQLMETLLQKMPTEKRLEGVSTEKRLEGVSTEKRLEGVSTEKRLEGVPAADRLTGLTPEELDQLRQLIENRSKGTTPG